MSTAKTKFISKGASCEFATELFSFCVIKIETTKIKSLSRSMTREQLLLKNNNNNIKLDRDLNELLQYNTRGELRQKAAQSLDLETTGISAPQSRDQRSITSTRNVH